MEWTVHGERSLYESPWVSLRLVDVEVQDGMSLTALLWWMACG